MQVRGIIYGKVVGNSLTNQFEYGSCDWCFAAVGAVVAETIQRQMAQGDLAIACSTVADSFFTGVVCYAGADGYELAGCACVANLLQWTILCRMQQ